MEESKKEEPSFPESFEYFDDLIAKDLERLKEIESLLQREPVIYQKPNPAQLNYKLPDFIKGTPSKNQWIIRDTLEKEQELKRSKVIERIELEMNNLSLSSDEMKQIKEVLLDKLYPNQYDNLTLKELQKANGIKKDLDNSQNFIRTKMRISKSEKSQDKTVEAPQDQKKNANMSAGLKFIQSLSSARAFEPSPDIPTVTFKKDMDDFLPDN